MSYKTIATFPWGSVYAKRTEGGGLEYWSDDVGGGQRVVDMTVVDVRILKWIVDNHVEIDKLFDRLKT